VLNGIRTTKLISPSTSRSTETPQLGIRAGLQGHSVKAGGGQDSKEAATKHHMDWDMVTGVYATSSQLNLLLTRFFLRTRTRAASLKIKHGLVSYTQTPLTVIELYHRLVPCPHPSFCVRQVTMAVSWNVITQRYVFDTIPSLFGDSSQWQ